MKRSLLSNLVPTTLVSRLRIGHVVPVLVVTLALAMTLGALLRMTSVLNAISEMELHALHKESALHRASSSINVVMRKHERACRVTGNDHRAREDIARSLEALVKSLGDIPDTGPGMREVALGWIAAAGDVLDGRVCDVLNQPSRQAERAQLDDRMTNLWERRLTELHHSLEEKEEQVRQVGVRAVAVGTALSVASLTLALYLARRLASSVNVPLSRLARSARLIGQGDFSSPVEVEEGPAEIVALADELLKMQRQLAELDSLKQGFLASVSHELRTPLSKIREALALLGDGAVGPLQDKQLRVVRIARAACEREIRMVTTLLDLSRLRTGSPLRFNDGVSISAVLETAILDEAQEAQSRNVPIIVRISGDLAPKRLDPVLFERAIANLIRNAVSVSPSGKEVRVSAETVERPEHPGRWVRITVADEGPGVPKFIQDTVFNAFVTSPVPRSPKAIGVGLGLALAREVALAHGGDLELDVEATPGASFHLWLPVDETSKHVTPAPWKVRTHEQSLIG